MSDSKAVQVVIPFRDRGNDPRRGANLDVVLAWWWAWGYQTSVVSDGLTGDAPFNRHRAYNRAVSGNPDAEVFVFTEADMLIHPDQITQAVSLAAQRPGLVVPFREYRYLSDSTTGFLRDRFGDLPEEDLAEWIGLPVNDHRSIFEMNAEWTKVSGKSIGAVSVVSRTTLDITGGFTEATSGNWYDDNIIEEGFKFLTGSPTRWVKGPATHMYHLPGWTGDHLTEQDKIATANNKRILINMRTNIRMRDKKAVKHLLSYRSPEGARS